MPACTRDKSTTEKGEKVSDLTLRINGKEVRAEKGMTILEAARSAGIYIPVLCYDRRLTRYGACRLCMVEMIKGGRSRLVASCVYNVEDGLEVLTDSPRVIKFRKALLELMLANAPEVKAIQGYAKRYGVSKTRFEVESPNLCILCGRCVRYCAKVKKANAIGFVGRGTKREVKFLLDIATEECPSCKECFSLCPTRLLPSIYESQVELKNE